MADLHVYANDVVEWYVAESEDEVWKLWLEQTGEKRDDYEDMTFDECPDDNLLKIFYEDESDIPNPLPNGAYVDHENHRVVATHSAWAKLNGKGFLCSTEY